MLPHKFNADPSNGRMPDRQTMDGRHGISSRVHSGQMAESVAKIESKITETFSQTCVGLGLALGSKLGLFTAIADIAADLWTAADLAQATGCKERYILEWLGLMASAGLIKIDNQTERYYVTAEMKTCLNGMAIRYIGFLPALFHAFPYISHCFKLNGPNGLPMYDQQVQMLALDSLREKQMISEIQDTDFVQAFPGFKDRLESGITVADLGCGAGRLAMALAEKFPKSQIFGLDFDEQAIELGRKRGQERNLKNLHMSTQDVHNLPVEFKDKFDVVIAMFVIHDLPFPKRALEQIFFTLKPNTGILCMVEIDVPSGQKNNITHPNAAGLYAFSIFDCVPNAMSIEGGTVLGACGGRDVLAAYAMEAGFKDTSYKPTNLVFDAVIIVCNK